MKKDGVSRRSVLALLPLRGAFGLSLLGRESAAEPQPHMQAALAALKTAAAELNLADRDKGGHRERAVEFVGKAIEQVQRGITYDNRH